MKKIVLIIFVFFSCFFCYSNEYKKSLLSIDVGLNFNTEELGVFSDDMEMISSVSGSVAINGFSTFNRWVGLKSAFQMNFPAISMYSSITNSYYLDAEYYLHSDLFIACAFTPVNSEKNILAISYGLHMQNYFLIHDIRFGMGLGLDYYHLFGKRFFFDVGTTIYSDFLSISAISHSDSFIGAKMECHVGLGFKIK